MDKGAQVVGFIDATPRWQDVLPIILMGLSSGNKRSVQIAEEELLRMAKAADEWNAYCKREHNNEH